MGGVLDALRRRLRVNSTRTPGLDRFAWAQALSGAADALVAVSLAGSLFFNISPEASEEQVLLYLTVEGRFDRECLGVYTLVEEVNNGWLKSRFGGSGGSLMKRRSPSKAR